MVGIWKNPEGNPSSSHLHPGLGVVLAILLLHSAGCALKRPSWWNPGTAQQQQMQATQHDPYAYNDIAPEVVGGRPRDYARQTPEAVRNDDGSRDGMVRPFR